MMPKSPVNQAPAAVSSTRIADTLTVAYACHAMRSSTVGRRSSSDAITHSATNAGTSRPCSSSGRIGAGSSGLAGLRNKPQSRPEAARKSSVWWMYRRLRRASERGTK
jgi:hypothetical protein